MKTLTLMLGLAAVGAVAPDMAFAQRREFYEPTVRRTAALQPMPPNELPNGQPHVAPASDAPGALDEEFKKWDGKDCQKEEDEDEDDKSCTSSCDEEDEEEECPKHFGGWLRQSYTWNPQNPANRFNGPVTFTDRSNEYQMNELYMYLKKDVDTDGHGIDVGGRVDVLYGTDSRFTQALGLDDRIVSDADSRFYKMAIPQMYASFGWNDLTVNIGHYYTIIGYETVMSPQNFFVTQSFLMQYGEPFTHTGVQATYKANDNWTLTSGFNRGWDTWEDNNEALSYMGGATWTSDDGDSSLAFALITGPEDNAGQANRTMFSVVYSEKLSDSWSYVAQWDQAYQQPTATNYTTANGLPPQSAEWWGINQYLFYTVNCEWRLGLRYSLFDDDDGVRVQGLGTPRGIPLLAQPRRYQAVSLGAYYKPNEKLLVRSECRWDWSKNLVPNVVQPFDDFSKNNQFLWSTDIVLLW